MATPKKRNPMLGRKIQITSGVSREEERALSVINAKQFCLHCDDFFTSRGMPKHDYREVRDRIFTAHQNTNQ